MIERFYLPVIKSYTCKECKQTYAKDLYSNYMVKEPSGIYELIFYLSCNDCNHVWQQAFVYDLNTGNISEGKSYTYQNGKWVSREGESLLH